jgi:hypothetical protein
MDTNAEGLAYINEAWMVMIEYLNEGPLCFTLKEYLMTEFGEHGRRRTIAKDQEIAQSACKNPDQYCCGYCAAYRPDPLLEEIADVIRGFRTDTIDINCDPRSCDYHVREDTSSIPF